MKLSRNENISQAQCHLFRRKETKKCPENSCTPAADGAAEARGEAAMRSEEAAKTIRTGLRSHFPQPGQIPINEGMKQDIPMGDVEDGADAAGGSM